MTKEDRKAARDCEIKIGVRSRISPLHHDEMSALLESFVEKLRALEYRRKYLADQNDLVLWSVNKGEFEGVKWAIDQVFGINAEGVRKIVLASQNGESPDPTKASD